MATQAQPMPQTPFLRRIFVGDEPMTVGLWGMVFFIFSELMFFSGLIAAYLALREDAVVWAPTNGGHVLGADFRPVFFTILLVLSSIPMQWAAMAIRQGKRRQLRWGLFLTLFLGVAFIINTGVEWATLDFGIGDGPYGATFYILTGFHGAHVIGGLIFIFTLWLRTYLGHFDAKRNTAVEAASMYWHFVDVVWILVFSLLFLA